MLAYLRGKIRNKTATYIILDISGVGYKVYMSETLLSDLPIDQECEVYVHQHVREDNISLFGFKSLGQLELFELLLTINGIGPKSALGVIGIAPVEDIKASIRMGDSSLLTKVSGIGAKTAERVVLDLRDKIAKISGAGDSAGDRSLSASGEEIDALMALGYSLAQAREALRQVDPEIKGSGERIRAALRSIKN